MKLLQVTQSPARYVGVLSRTKVLFQRAQERVGMSSERIMPTFLQQVPSIDMVSTQPKQNFALGFVTTFFTYALENLS